MIKYLIITSLFLLLILGCKTTKTVGEGNQGSEKTYAFPMDWIGRYEGDLIIHGLKNDTTLINMELIIDQPDGLGMYPWILIYGGKDVREYGLETVDAEKGHYRVDEYNSIKLDGFLRGNHFITRFNVSENDLTFHYERNENGIDITVHITGEESYANTGGEIIGKDTIPNVSVYAVRGFQTATLLKVK